MSTRKRIVLQRLYVSVGKAKTLQRVRESHRKQNKPSVKVSPGQTEAVNRWWCLGDVSLGLPDL